MTIIANPIYDSAFKYLLEDNRAAKVLLSALLKQEVCELEMRPNEYSNVMQDRISMFRIDFAAKIRDAAGEEHLVVIELQKTWLPTETLRFRRYLGAQYLAENNVPGGTNPKGYGLPIISIYILGHKLGDLHEPVVYVRRRYLDYDSREIHEGVPDPFVESLTHDSIIVQIPFLKGRARNHLERLLTIFDQTCQLKDDKRMLEIDDTDMEPDTLLLVGRLQKAALLSDIRNAMWAEEEFLSEIETRDTELMQERQRTEEANRRADEAKQRADEEKQRADEAKRHEEEARQRAAFLQDHLRATARNLTRRGLSVDEIAGILSLSVEETRALLDT